MGMAVINKNSTMDELYKIREENYQRRKNMTMEDCIKDIQMGASEGLLMLEKLKREKFMEAAQAKTKT